LQFTTQSLHKPGTVGSIAPGVKTWKQNCS